MPYESDLDEELCSKSCETDFGQLNVSVHSYNKGVKKLQIARENKDPQGELRFSKLGRMSKKEVESILPLIQEALSAMD